LIKLRAKARELLLSNKGKVHRRQRPVAVESVFGKLKQNKGFWRFILLGIDKVSIEFGLLALAHNLKRMAA
jgi:hypothetical protein